LPDSEFFAARETDNVAKSNTPFVAVLVDTATGWGRGLVRGIVNYGRRHGPWYLWIKSGGQQSPLRLPPGWRGDGIIATVGRADVARHVAAAHVPVVNTSAVELPGVDFPRVATDRAATGRVAAEHLLDRGFQHFAYYGAEPRKQFEQQYSTFAKSVAHVAAECPAQWATVESGEEPSADWRKRQQSLRGWLKKLPKPVAVFTSGTELGREVIHVCRRSGLAVPEQVAVLAGENDGLLCEVCVPSLSGLALSSERIGSEAAATLDRLMQGQRAAKGPILLAPTGVFARQSTDTLAVDEPDLVRAMAFIRSHATDPIQVDDVLRELAVSRRWLERRFHELLGRGPGEEIRRVRLERAKLLLAETDMPVPEVAVAAGFCSREYFATTLKSQTGLSPRQYRRSVRPQH
jgi:LacI family transcriptional regulator